MKISVQSEESPRVNPLHYSRRKTREVMVGDVGVGGEHPIRIQSMTTTSTMDTEATVAQILRLAEAGCEIARVTVPTVKEARNLERIKAALMNKGCRIPLVADIHFQPDAAMLAAEFVEKVRINPGNFADTKAFKKKEYSDDEYRDELKKLEEKFTPLVLKLKSIKRALRVGTNHGSLSDRVLNRFGDTPVGMVESTLEFVRVCQKNNFHNIILSIKASNPRMMIAANRLLVQRMSEEGMDYPIHLGVTEAGFGEDGRIKSAVGIGGLLEDGVGDTIRVSLTEEPEMEIPVGRELAERFDRKSSRSTMINNVGTVPSLLIDNENGTKVENRPVKTLGRPVHNGNMEAGRESKIENECQKVDFSRRETKEVRCGPVSLGGGHPIRVSGRVDSANLNFLKERINKERPLEIIELASSRFMEGIEALSGGRALFVRFDDELVQNLECRPDGIIFDLDDAEEEEKLKDPLRLKPDPSSFIIMASSPEVLLAAIPELIKTKREVVLGLKGGGEKGYVQKARFLVANLKKMNFKAPLLLLSHSQVKSLGVAAQFGSLICDGIGDGIQVADSIANESMVEFAYDLLQACGVRTSKAEFISCPSCGRTLFDIQSTTERIKARTGHLKGVKIAIMGCIVNGPGEMADADFGFVGGGPGKINLYVGQKCVQKSIPASVAEDKLIELIKNQGRWVERHGVKSPLSPSGIKGIGET